MSKLEKALLSATGIKAPRAGEDRQKFLLRAMLAVQKVPSDDWEALPEDLQEWYNKAVEADNSDKPVPDFPDVKVVSAKPAAEEEGEDSEDSEDSDASPADEEDEDAADLDEAEDESEQEEEVMEAKKKDNKKNAGSKTKPATKASKPAAKASPAAAKKNGAAPVKAAAPAKKGASMRRTLKMIVIKKPRVSTDDLIDLLEKKGFKSPSKLTVTSIRADTRDTIKVLNEAGITSIEL